MRQQISAQLNNLITVLIFAVVGLTPLLFSPLFTEFYETTKIAFLVFSILILVVLWTFSWVVQGKVLITRSPLDLPLLLFLAVIIASTVFSATRDISIYGNFPRIHGSTVTYVAYILFYFVTVSHLRTVAQVKNLLYVLLGSGAVVAVVSLLSYFNIYLPLPIAQFSNFSPAGSSFAANGLLLLLLPITLLSIVRPGRFVTLPVALGLSILFTLTIGLTGMSRIDGMPGVLSPAYIGLAVVYGLVLFLTKNQDLRKILPIVVLPLALTVLVLIISNLPIGGNANPLANKAKDFPQEVQLPFGISWKVSASAFRDSAFVGSGPSTYLFDFTKYRPVEQNDSQFWNVRFDSAFNEYLQVLGTLGGLGLMALVFLSAVIINFGYRGLADQENIIARGLALSALMVVVLLALHVTTVVIMIAALTVLAMLMAIHKASNNKVEELTIGIKASKLYDNNLVVGDILPVVIFIPVLILAMITFWKAGIVAVADYHHRLALNYASTPGRGVDTYNNLVKAENMNPIVDLYRTDLAQTNFALANAIAVAKGPSEASPAGSLTDADKESIQQLLSQAIREAQIATVLSPNNPANFEVLAAIYRQISGVADNALTFALNAYGQAISLDPYNPLLRLNVGGIYYSVKNYDLAIRFFTDAVNLKPDYANAYYNLAIALRDKGDLKNAEAVAQRVVTLLQTDTENPDYKQASEFLKDLQARIATGAAQNTAITPPAATSSSALQNQNLPKLDIPATDKNVATPPAATR